MDYLRVQHQGDSRPNAGVRLIPRANAALTS
jgi:hypothetical protein